MKDNEGKLPYTAPAEPEILGRAAEALNQALGGSGGDGAGNYASS